MCSRLFPALYVGSFLHLLQLFFSFRWNDIWLVHCDQDLAIITCESESIFVTFLFYSFRYTRTSLWSNMKPRFVFTNYQFLWSSKVVWLWAVVYQIYLPINLFLFLLDGVTIKPAHISCPGVRWSFGAYHLHSLFSCCCLCLQDHQGQYVNFEYFHKYICPSSKTIFLKTKTGLFDCYLCVIVKRCQLYR